MTSLQLRGFIFQLCADHARPANRWVTAAPTTTIHGALTYFTLEQRLYHLGARLRQRLAYLDQSWESCAVPCIAMQHCNAYM